MPPLSFNATHEDGSDATEELLAFAKYIGLESAAGDRYSFLLLLQLFGAAKSGHLNPAKVVSQIRVLEGLEECSGLKAPTPFKGPALKGLWHQHYAEDGLASFAKNIQKGLNKFGLPDVKQKIAEAKSAGVERYFTEEDMAEIANEIVETNWKRLKEQKAITGEWLIFAKYESSNYYLGLGKHNSGDECLRSEIDSLCLQEFPFLQSILSTYPPRPA